MILTRLHATLSAWLTQSAYPLWARCGIDAQSGGFFEALAQNGRGLDAPRRARVHPRQMYAFAQARRFGWRGDASDIIRRGLEYFTACYRRDDGLFRTLVDSNGAPLDERALLYDQAFALLGYAAAADTLIAAAAFERRALALRSLIERRFAAEDGGFRSSEVADGERQSNPHMHLLEACIAWSDIGADPSWARWVDDLVQLALSRMIRPDTGALGESYTSSWQSAPGVAGRVVEPGHQYEWAWLLLRADESNLRLRHAALRLIEAGERGVHNRVAVNSLLDDFTVHDANARFWPQTERLKAALTAARVTGDQRYWSMARDAASSFLPYLASRVPGLWLDVQKPDGEILDSPAPASTFYHIVSAISALDDALAVESRVD